MPPNSEIEKLERRWRDNPKGTVFAPYAEVLRKNGDHALAREVLSQGLELHPDHIPGNIVLGRCCLDIGEDGPAEAAFAHVLDLDSENVIALKALADITERQGRLAEADSWLNRLMSVDPSNDEARDQHARVNAARESAAAALTSEIVTSPAPVTAPVPAVSTVEVRVDELVAQDKLEAKDRSEVAHGEIDDVGDVAAFADEALDSFLTDAPAPPTAPVLEITAVTPAYSPPSPAPLAGLESSSLNLADATPDLEPLADLTMEEEFTPPVAEVPAPRPSGPFAIGVETAPEIEIKPAATSEFQAPDASNDLLELTPHDSEFQVPDTSADLAISATGSSEFQSPDASEELRVSGHGSSEYQTPSGAEELLRSSQAARMPPPEPEVEPEPAPVLSDRQGPVVSGSMATLAAMPTQEIPTDVPAADAPAASDTPSWFFEEDTVRASGPAAELPLIEPEPEPAAEPEPVSSASEAESTPELEAEPPIDVAAEEPAEETLVDAPVAAVDERSSAELKLIFPDDAARPEPHRVRRITQADLATPEEHPDAPVGEPEPVLTETVAELYARQGHFAEALKVYRALAAEQPGDARLRDRIRELESKSANAARRHAYVASDTGGESVESFFRTLAGARPGGSNGPTSFDPPGMGDEDNGGAPTRPARDPLSLSAIFGEEPAAAATRKPDPPAPPPAPSGPDAFSFDQFFGGPSPSGPGSAPSRPSGASDEDLDQFQNWLKSLKR